MSHTDDGSEDGYDGSEEGYGGSEEGYDGSEEGYDGSEDGYDGSEEGYDKLTTKWAKSRETKCTNFVPDLWLGNKGRPLTERNDNAERFT